LKTQEATGRHKYFSTSSSDLNFRWLTGASDTFPTKIIMEVSMEKAVVATGMIWLEDFAFEVTACGDIFDDSMVRRCQDTSGHVM